MTAMVMEPEYTAHALRGLIEQFGFEIGDYSYGVPRVHVGKAHLKIGRFCSIGRGVFILLGAEHRPDWVTTYPFNAFHSAAEHIQGVPHSKGDVIIGNDVWIGQGASILSGVTIGDGACIGAGALVSRDVPPYGVAAGNPARLIRLRFTEEQIAALLELKWWDWPIEDIEPLFETIMSSDIDGFIAAGRARAAKRT